MKSFPNTSELLLALEFRKRAVEMASAERPDDVDNYPAWLRANFADYLAKAVNETVWVHEQVQKLLEKERGAS